MLPGVLNLRFKVSFHLPVLVVIEPSEKIWKGAHKKIADLLDVLYGRAEHICFLGSRTFYPITIPNEFNEKSSAWFEQNRNRVGLIGPILEKLSKSGFSGMIVVFCSAFPVDVEDWTEKEVLERVLFVTTPDESSDGGYRKIGINAPLDSIKSALDNPVKGVLIKGKGFVPLQCDIKNAVLIYNENEGNFDLKIPVTGGGLECHLQCLCTGSAPLLYVERERGPAVTIRGKEERPWFNEPVWEEIPKDMRPVIEAGIAKRNFTCPLCKQIHKPDTFFCPEGSFILKGMPLHTCILLRKWDYLALSERYAYPLKEGKRVITAEGRVYDWTGEVWQFVDKIRAYGEVDNEVWGLYI